MTESPALPGAPPAVQGAYVDLDGERYYRLANLEGMAPFLIALASDSDHWMFVSSNGALTAGRRDPDTALFPYYPDDRIHDGQDQTGSKTLMWVRRGATRALWEPFSPCPHGPHRITRSLDKSVYGNKIRFEEQNHDLGLTFAYAWMFSERFGLVRRAWLREQAGEPVEIELLDGIQNLLPSGVSRRFQLEYSTLADGYKKNELDAATGLGLYMLSSIPTDKAEPSESLRATVVWSEGLPAAARLLCTAQLGRFRQGLGVSQELDVRGRRGAYLMASRLALPAGGGTRWHVVAEVQKDATAVAGTLQLLRARQDLARALTEDVDRGTRNLVRIVASADGLQLTGDELDTWRHYSNTLYNVLRGGIPDDGYQVQRADVTAFVRAASRPLAERHAAFLAALPERLLRGQLVALAEAQGDPDLERLAREYLPITFGRRHGDPSRPWNQFTIRVKDDEGRKVLDYQGNWRDIFQNWEALALSFPALVEAMIVKFLDCSTADGHNPYHVLRSGFDWEVTDPRDEWSFIGYWGDHQVIYLLKLLERLSQYQPEALPRLLGRRIFAFANVPYRIKPYAALLADPQRTIDFDAALDQAVREREARIGADGKLLPGTDGQPARASLTEKLLLVVLARMANYVAEAGIWMNTQRPEWNDANNALVGNGVSMVTLCYLRRYLAFLRPWLLSAEGEALEVAEELATLLGRMAAALAAHQGPIASGFSERDRRSLLDALGEPASDYRAGIYQRGLSGRRVRLPPEQLGQFCDLALRHIDHSIRCNRRDDGLYHAYNLMSLAEGGGVRLRRLYEMLEGQVAVLSAGVLSPAEAAEVLDALRASSLYRADQDSYLLYPDRRLPRFLEKNNLAPDAVAGSPLLSALLAGRERSIILGDVEGGVHFHPSLRNAAALREALAALPVAEWGELVARHGAAVLALYEAHFDHQSFTGRSGTFYKYEGLGCIYWHMVSKLLLAVQEVLEQAERNPTVDPATRDRLHRHYAAIRAGIGVHKPPALYGAIPTDPHSHTPSFAGAQQPGMTGQVKEDILSRQGELGLRVEDGRMVFSPALARAAAFVEAGATFSYVDVDGAARQIELPPGSLAATACQVPVVVHRGPGPGGRPAISVAHADGTARLIDGSELDRATSFAIFQRTGAVVRLEVYLG